MATVYPEIVLQQPADILTNTTESEKKAYYFVSQAGKVTEIVAKNETIAKNFYSYHIMPKWYVPNNTTTCFFFPSFQNGDCNGRHCHYNNYWSHRFNIDSSLSFRYEENVEFLHTLFHRHPDFYDLGRFEVMYHETPTMEGGDYENSVTGSDGSVQYFNPRSFTYIWKKANVRCTLREKTEHPFHNAMIVLCNKEMNVICYAWVLANIKYLTSAQVDMLKGSFQALTERPIETPTAAVERLVTQNEIRKPSHLIRRRHYSPIEISSE
jgi:hypothetical protein